MRLSKPWLIFSLLAASVAQGEAPQEKLNATLHSLAESKETAAALAQKQARVREEYEQLQNRATELAERLQVSERRVTNEERALGTVTVKLSAKQKEFEARKADYAATVVTLLRLRTVR